MFARSLVRNSRPVDGPRVRESEWISVPMTMGQIVPTILLPIGWREWDSAKLQAVLAHEEAHIRRADWAIGVMARINCCVFWFHPLAWWLKRELALLAEYACDDSALDADGRPAAIRAGLARNSVRDEVRSRAVIGGRIAHGKGDQRGKKNGADSGRYENDSAGFRTARLGNAAGVQLACGVRRIDGSVSAGTDVSLPSL